MARQKGSEKTGGRQKGSRNKLTADLKQMILGALDAKGGQRYLEEQASENPVAFMTLIGAPSNAAGKFGKSHLVQNHHWRIAR